MVTRLPVLLLALLTFSCVSVACSDSSDDDQAYGDRQQDDGEDASQNAAERAHQRAINAIRQSADMDDDDDREGEQPQANLQGNPQQNRSGPQNSNAYNTPTNNNAYNNTPAPAPSPNRYAQQQNTPSQNSSNTQQGNEPRGNNAQPVVQNASQNYSVFKEHKLTDPGMNNVHSHTVLVPEEWKVEGGVIRPNIKLYNMPTMVDLKITAPDGRQAHIMPALSFEFNYQSPGQPGQPTLNGNIYMPLPESAGKWLLQMAQNQPDPNIKDLKLVSEKMEEKLTAQLRKQAQPLYQSTAQFNQTAAGIGMGAAYDTQAQVITFTYTENDQQFEETFLVCWYVNLTSIQGQISNGMWGVTLLISVRDKPGKDPSKDPMLQTFFQSFRATPVWQNEMNKYWAELSRIKAKGSADRAAQNAKHNEYMRKNNEEINNIIVNGYKTRTAISDRGQQNTIDTIREVTPYQTPGGETVRLPSYYNHAYTDGNGRYLLNNDSNFNPNVDPNFNNRNWQTIEQAPAGTP